MWVFIVDDHRLNIDIQKSGKSTFLFFLNLLLCRVCGGQPAAFKSSGSSFILFDNGSVTVYDDSVPSMKAFPALTFSHSEPGRVKIWAFTDSNDDTTTPCTPFLQASNAGRAWIVQTTSPLVSPVQRLEEESWCVIDCFTPTEFISLRLVQSTYWMCSSSPSPGFCHSNVLGIDGEILRELSERWGPSTRIYTQLARNPWNVEAYGTEVSRRRFR